MGDDEPVTVRAGRTGREIVVRHQVGVIGGAVPQPARILEVGCGRGEVAAALARAGHQVTAIDPGLPDDVSEIPGVRFERVALEQFTDVERYDAVAFTASLHHVDALDPALERAAALLAPGGVLIVDDFDLGAPDDATALWFFEIQELFAVAGLYDPTRIDGKATQPPAARWIEAHARHGHGADHPLHGGAAMIAAIRARFAAVEVATGPYLYRYAAAGLRGPRAAWIAEAILDAEERRLELALIKPVGLTITARAR